MSEREMRLGVPPDAVWTALVSPERHHWYYQLQPEGAFEPGSVIRWLREDGQAQEESKVLEAEPGRRLVLESRFLFAPALAAAPPHRVEWSLEPDAGGTLVTLSWSGDGPAPAMLAAETQAHLLGLRLAVDPAAQAEVARRRRIGEVSVRDLTPERLGDYQAFFDGDAFRDYPAWQACYCMEPIFAGSDDEWAIRTAEENRRDVSARVSRGEVTALVAYADGKPVGWCHYGVTTRLAGLMRRHGFDAGALEGVGSLACFVVAAPYRGHGVATRLLEAALERLRGAGCRVAEAYPARHRSSPQANYHGPLEMYLRAGFEPYRDEPDRPLIVRKALV